MKGIELKLNDEGHGAFVIEEDGHRDAEMVVSVSDGSMTVYHTEVDKKLQGQGIAGKLLDAMAQYARTHKLKVTPLCEYVHAQFRKSPEKYADIWKR